MAITATQIESSNSLEQFRQEFNNLQSDVSGLEAGTISFAAITTTSSNTTTLNVREDGTIKFEGATDDGFETTLTVTDPTANRTITFPNESGTVILAGTASNSLITGQTTIASGAVATGTDELLLSDASASSFKRITVDALISSAGGLTSIVGDTSPQLGGNLDINGADIVSTSNADIDIIPNGTGNVNLGTDTVRVGDNNANATITTQGTGDLILSTNSGTNAGLITMQDGANGNIVIAPNGTGTVNVDTNVEISDGLIELKTGTGNVAKIKFYCESANQHFQTLQAAVHDANSSAVLVLPIASGNLIGTGDTGTLPLAVINIDGGTDIGADLTTADLIVVDDGAGGTNRKSTFARVVTLMRSQLDDPTALAIALG